MMPVTSLAFIVPFSKIIEIHGGNELMERKSIEEFIEKKLEATAKELVIDFRVKHSIGPMGPDFLIRIKNNELTKEKVAKFTDLAHHTIVPLYANQVRFSYPSRL